MRKHLILGGVIISFLIPSAAFAQNTKSVPWWSIQSVDTMKYSRDLARAKLHDPSFNSVIDTQVKNISATGANYVAIGTPYDAEFLPFLRRWISAARRYNLKVWFRGNWSGWEKWFEYPSITRVHHLEKTRSFILSHPDLFENGDIFSSCPECENGGPGDPRNTGDVEGYRKFLLDLYTTSSQAFTSIGKEVKSNYFSANGDVAKLIWDPATTTALGGIVVVDHYVATPEKLVQDIKKLAESSRGKIVLGEFGAPIPEIHGKFSQEQQSVWLTEALILLAQTPEVIGLNYWTNEGGSTSLWDQGVAKPAAAALTSAYTPPTLTLSVKNAAGQSVKSAQAEISNHLFMSDSQGKIYVPRLKESSQITVTASGYYGHGLVPDFQTPEIEVILQKTHENWLFKLQALTYRLLRSILP